MRPRADLQPRGGGDGARGGKNDVGNMVLVYIHMTGNADVAEVARDVREHGPTIAIFTCAGAEDAQLLAAKLKEPTTAVGTNTRGGGDRTEKQFVCTQHKHCVLAGRLGVVASIDCRHTATVCGSGSIVIAEVTLNVQVSGQMIFRLAALDLTQAMIVQDSSWDDVRDLLKRFLVRFVAGEFGSIIGLFLKSLSGKMAANVVAFSRYRVLGDTADYTTGSFIVVLGPIENRTILQGMTEAKPDSEFPDLLLVSTLLLPENALVPSTHTRGSGGNTWTKDWPVIQKVKQKATSPLPRFTIVFMKESSAGGNSI